MGGGVMRTAAKAATIGGYRSAGHFSEAAAARRASYNPSATIPAAASTGESGLFAQLLSEATRADVTHISGIQRPAWEFDDWEFTGGKSEELFDTITPTPRLVFGPVPTLEEAKEATSDLKDAVEKVCFTNSDFESVKSNKGSTISESSTIISGTPKHVFQAFTMLQGSTEAQNVVASLASDKNLWDAVMKNEKVMEFYKNNVAVVSKNGNVEEYVESSEMPKKETSGSSVFSDWVKSIKVKVNIIKLKVSESIKLKTDIVKVRVSEIVNNLSELFQDFKGTSTGASDAKARADSHSEYYATGASFLALAVAVILVVLVKRGA